jgi:S1-C subfamily serine protease
MSYEEWSNPGPTRGLRIAVVAAAVGAAGALLLSLFALISQQGSIGEERRIRANEDTRLTRELRELRGDVQVAEKQLSRKEKGIAPLATRLLKSVFTVHTDTGLGSGFAAWHDADGTFVITAHHVVAGLVGSHATLSRTDGSWAAELVEVDPRNDLAVLRIDGLPKGMQPLWQNTVRERPRPGDQLLLLGSPFGLEGTVTTGIVSRVTKEAIQTDAAANPGNSGGPAVDKRGRVVGVLVAGGGQNVNFAVPIERVCAKLRRCG